MIWFDQLVPKSNIKNITKHTYTNPTIKIPVFVKKTESFYMYYSYLCRASFFLTAGVPLPDESDDRTKKRV